MKQIIAILMFLACSLTVGAQQFNPEKFAKDREAFVMKEAGLTQQEADKFFCHGGCLQADHLETGQPGDSDKTNRKDLPHEIPDRSLCQQTV